MLKKIAKLGFQLLPEPMQKRLRIRLMRMRRKTLIEKWKRSGKPLPAPHVVKQSVIEHYKSLSNYNVFVETGTYLGDMVEAQRKSFRKIYSIELGEQLWRSAVKRFAKYKYIKILQGDSGKVLNKVIRELNEPAIFWLDGHYSAGITAKGEKECPIFEEIDAIFKGKSQEHILLVDDARCFNGQGDYPTIESLTKYIKSKDERYNVEINNDVICYTIG